METGRGKCAEAGGLRFVIKVACILALAATLGPFPGGPKAAGDTSRSVSSAGDVARDPRARLHTVEKGETLWAIALAYYPDNDPRCGVDSIMSANTMAGATLQVGAVLVIPPSPNCT